MFNKTITDPPDCFNKGGIRRIFFDLAAQTVDVGIHCVVITIELVSPNNVQQLLPVVGPAWIFGKQGQQIEFLGGQVNFIAG